MKMKPTLILTLGILISFGQLFSQTTSLDRSQYATDEAYRQAKAELESTVGYVPGNHDNILNNRDYPPVQQSNGNRAGACWYPLDGSFTAIGSGDWIGGTDDGYYGPIALPFTFTFYGNTWTELYINTNGNVTFGGGYTAYTATGFPDAGGPDMVAPFWSDVDLGGTGGGIDNTVYYKIETGGGMNRIIIIWNEVGYYNSNTSPINTFQLILTDGVDPLLGVGLNAQFAYDDMNWCVGDISSVANDGFDPDATGSLTQPSASQNFGTAGAQNSAGANYYTIGNFGRDNSAYDGPAGDNDGIHYLDDGCYITDISGLNTPPIANGFPSGAVDVCVGETYTLSTAFSSPEVGQTTAVTVTNSTLAGTWNTTITDGNYATQDISITPDAADVGSHTFVYTATDDGTPTGTTVVNLEINVIAAPTPTITGNTDYCAGGSTTLDAGGGYVSYSWSTTETTQAITVSSPATYTVTVSDGTCSGSANVVVTENTNPTPSITPSGATTFCDGSSVDLDAGSYTSYSWSTTETTQTITASTSGTYTVTVTDANGCTGQDSEVITVNANPTPSITPSGATTFCDGNTLNLDAGNGYSSYSWSNAESTQAINVTTSATYTVTVTDGNGCTGQDSEVVTVNANPAPSITPSGATTFCDGGSVDLDAGSFTSYSWSTTETTQTITANTSGTYTVTVTDGNGCTGQDSEVVTVNANPTPSITPSGATTFCDGSSVDLIADNGYAAYSWSTTETTQTITASTSGTYTVTVTDGNGCSGQDSEVVTVNTNPTPSITPSGATTFCNGSSVDLDAGSYTSYSWSTTETTQTVTASTSGTYTVTVTDGNGCTGQDSEVVTVNSNPTASIAGSTSYCTGFSSTLDAGGGYSAYSWSTGDNTQTISATTADNPITVTVTDANGCTDTSSPVTLTENSILTPTVSGSTEYCAGSNTTLDAGGGYTSYSWTPGSETTQAITVTAGTYSVTVTDANGCTGTSSNVVVTENANPTPSISGPTEYCEGSSSTLNAGAGYSVYAWSTGDNSQTISATDADNTISVTVTDANGCSGTSAGVDLTENANPTPTITGTLDYCAGSNTTLVAGAGYSSYLWSTGGNTQTTTATAANNPISVIVTDANGCSGTSSSVVLTENSNPTPTITGSTEYCEGSSSTLDAGAGYSVYTWSTGDNTQTIAATDADNTITVTVTDGNGCSGTSAGFDLTENANPVPTITGTLSYCAGNSTTLTATAGYSSYSWSPGGQSTQSIITTAGTYDVTVTDANGCSGTSASVTVTENALPTPSITGSTEYCEGSNTSLDAGAGYVSYSWSSGDNTQTAIVTAGTYDVTVTDGNGCSNTSASVTVTENANPTPAISGTLEYCAGANTTLDAGAGYSVYAWSTGDNTQTAVVTAGSYDVTVTDGNGCVGTSPSVTVNENANPTPTISGSSTYCNGGSSSLSTQAGFTTYSWTTGSSGVFTSATQADNPISVTVIDANGCTGTSADFTVTETAALSPSISGSLDYCASDGSTTLDAGSGYDTYTWSTGATTQTIVATTADNSISVTVTDANGCSGTSATVDVVENANPTPTISGTLDYCAGDSTQLTADAGYTAYSWDNGDNTISTYVTAGTYTVTVTDANGCQGTDSQTVTENSNPTASITGTNTFCTGGSTTLDAGAGYTYEWLPNGEITQTININVADDYSVVITDGNGCSDTSSDVTVTEFVAAAPNVYGSTTFCTGGNTVLNTDSYASYSWSPGSETTQSITVSAAGTYSVTVTDNNGCITTSNNVVVTENTFLTPSISGSLDYCEGSTATLDAGSGYATYTWSTGATTQTISATETDNSISVTVVDGNGCTGTSATVDVTERANPTPVISGDLEYCEGGNVTLDAGAGYNSYLWSDGTTSQTNTVTTGAFAVTVTNAYGCLGLSPGVNVVENVNPTPVIMGDTSYCSGSTSALDAGSYDTYLWANGATTQTIAAVTGTYDVTVTDANGCTGTSPSFSVTVYPTPTPVISGNDSICDGETTTLYGGSGYASYVWSNGMGGNPVSVGTAGTYNVVVTSNEGCSNISPNFTLVVLPNPTATISAIGETVFCDIADVNTTLDAGTGFDSYTWSPGSENTSSIVVTSPGLYNVTVVNSDGCSDVSDDFEVIASTLTSPQVQITGDTTLCDGEESQLYLNDSYYTYEWNSGSTTPSIIVNHSGDYWVTVSDEYGCTESSDTVTVTVDELPMANFNYSSPAMTINFTDLSSGNVNSWSWDFGDGNTSTLQDPSHTYADAGSYPVTLVVSNDCGSDSISFFVAVKPTVNIGIGELTVDQITVYPNPTIGDLNIVLPFMPTNPVMVRVNNTIGQTVMESAMSDRRTVLNLGQLNRGIYFIEINDGINTYTKKITVL